MAAIEDLVRQLSDCPICCDQLEEIRECPSCHSLFCKECLEPWLQSRSTCPSCRSRIRSSDCTQNIPVQRFVEGLPVICPHNLNGCRAMPAKSDLEAHQLACEFHPKKLEERLADKNAKLRKQVREVEIKIKRLNNSKDKQKWEEIVAELFVLCKGFFEVANYEEAVRLSSKALEISIKILDSELECRCLCKKGLYLMFQTRYDDALQSLQKCSELLESKKIPANKIDEFKAKCMKIKGECYLKQSKFGEAKGCLDIANDIYLKNPTSSKIMAELLNSLGLLAKKQSKFSDAATFYKQALKFVKESDSLWCSIAINYADNARKLGELDEAEAQYNKTIIVIKKTFGSDKVPQCAQIYNSLGIIEKKKGNYKKALEYYKLSSKITKQFFGSKNPQELTAINQANIGDVFRKLGDYEKAETSYFIALEILEKLYGPEHVEVAEILHSQGLVCKKRGSYDEAENYHTRALTIIEKSLGTSHYKYGIFSNSLGDVERKRGRYNEAMAIYSRALKILQDTLGASHIEVAEVLFNMGLVDHQLEKYKDALKKFSNSREIIIREFGPGHYKEGLVLNNAGLAHGMLNQFEDAYKSLSEAKKILIKQLGADHVEVGDCLISLGDICMKLHVESKTKDNKLQEALNFYTDANKIVLKYFGSNHKKADQLASVIFICENYDALQ